MDWFSKVSTVLKLPNDCAIFFFTYDFAADFNTQFPWEKSEYPLDHAMLGVLGLSVTMSAIGGQGRTAETRGIIHFLYITFL